MKYIKIFEQYTKWYRGYTTTTNSLPYVWLVKNKGMAEVYSIINKASYGGDALVDEIELSLKGKNILKLSEYDMDDKMEAGELEDFLSEINVTYNDVDELFDFTEDSIPLSRLVNKILPDLMNIYDGIKIKESGKSTLCISRKFIK